MRRLVLALVALLGLAMAMTPVVVPEAPKSTVLLDRGGDLLGARIAADEQWRFPLSGAVPERFARALCVEEDARFRWHPGVDPLAVARAMGSNLSAGRVVSGASTLTMQTIRIARGNPPRTLSEKLLESWLALRLELSTDKDDILAMYAEHAPFGGNTVGVEAASWRYFGRPAADLSWAEAATLAVLPNRPGLIHPGRGRGVLKQRRDALLSALQAEGVLTSTDLELAVAEPLPGPPRPMPRLVPHLRDAADPGVHRTTLDRGLQARASEVLWRHHARLSGNRIHNAAALIADVETGEVLAYLGNVPLFEDDAHGHHVDIVPAWRSTGSLLKPFLYAAMLESGELLPDQLVPDLPMGFGAFRPENYDRAFEGAVPASRALARSRNLPAVWMLRQHGVDRFYGALQRLGMTTLFRPAGDYGLSLVLGGAEGTLWDLVGMYRRLGLSARGLTGPTLHWRVGEGRPLEGPGFEQGAAWTTLETLLEVERPGVHGAWRVFGSSRPIAWKTGTSMGFRDGWAIAVTPEVVVGVWTGNADGEGRPALTGMQAAAPLLFDLVDLVETGGWFETPPSMVRVEVCADSGMRAGPHCPHRDERLVPIGSLEGRSCAACTSVHLDPTTAQRVHAGCQRGDPMRTEGWFVLPPGQAWYYRRSHATYRDLPPWRSDCVPGGAAETSLGLLYPPPDASVYVPVELDGRRGRVVLQASHRDPHAEVHWHLDGSFVRTTRHLHELSVDPGPGAHHLVVVDSEGARAERRFVIVE